MWVNQSAGKRSRRLGRIMDWTLPTVTRNQLPMLVSSAFSTAHPSPVAALSLSAACSRSSPRWGEDQDAAPRVHAVLGDGAEDDGLAAPRGEDQQRALPALRPFALDGLPRLLLVGAQLHGGGH